MQKRQTSAASLPHGGQGVGAGGRGWWGGGGRRRRRRKMYVLEGELAPETHDASQPTPSLPHCCASRGSSSHTRQLFSQGTIRVVRGFSCRGTAAVLVTYYCYAAMLPDDEISEHRRYRRCSLFPKNAAQPRPCPFFNQSWYEKLGDAGVARALCTS